MSIWFTSDTHFGHGNIILYSKRPQYREEDFEEDSRGRLRWISKEVKNQRVREMDQMLVDNWNAVVKPGDRVYHLGDVSFDMKNMANIVKQLNGQIYLLLGNHDDGYEQQLKQTGAFVWIKHYFKLKVQKQKLILCHYPFARWDCGHRDAYCLHGHCHGAYRPSGGRILDVGVDCHPEFRPWHYDEVVEYMTTRSPISHHE